MGCFNSVLCGPECEYLNLCDSFTTIKSISCNDTVAILSPRSWRKQLCRLQANTLKWFLGVTLADSLGVYC